MRRTPFAGDLPDMQVDLPKLTAANQIRWTNAHIKSALVNYIDAIAARLVFSKPAYLAVASATRVPWPVIAVIHERESSQNWTASLAQGDPWNKPSTHVPLGRGPFHSWQEAAIDALTACPPHAAKWTNWTIGGALTLLEQYNGIGYALRDMPSPYVWAGTDQYVSGKFISDHHFDPNAIDHQLGCAALLMRMTVHDLTIKNEWRL